MARMTNNELSKLPGFFFYPPDKEGLEELTFQQRCDVMVNQGLYAVTQWRNDPRMEVDLKCMADNGRIPTHRRPGVAIPEMHDVPVDLREVIEL